MSLENYNRRISAEFQESAKKEIEQRLKDLKDDKKQEELIAQRKNFDEIERKKELELKETEKARIEEAVKNRLTQNNLNREGLPPPTVSGVNPKLPNEETIRKEETERITASDKNTMSLLVADHHSQFEKSLTTAEREARSRALIEKMQNSNQDHTLTQEFNRNS